MAPGVGIAWTPGGNLVTAGAGGPSHEMASRDPPAPFHKLFFQGHLHFMTPNSAVERSRLLRSAMIDCLAELEDPESLHARDLRAAISVWSFVEAVYLIDPAFDGSHVSSRLSDWYAHNFPSLLGRAREILLDNIEPENESEEDQFWSLVCRLAAVGSRGLAARLVSARLAREGFGKDWADTAGAAAMGVSGDSAAMRHSPLAIAEAMLAECPVDADSSFAARTDSSWVRWQDACDAWADEQEGPQQGRLKVLLKTLAGSVHHMALACKTWEEMLVATATYARRVLSDTRYDHGIVEIENACAEASSVFSPPDHIAGGALVDAALGQPAEAIVRLGASLNTSWYAAHLCDLLMQSKQLGPEAASKWMPAPGGVSLLEYFVLEFTRNLESNGRMWRIAADYYTQCPRKGRQRLKDMLRRVTSVGAVDPVVEKVLAFCDSNDLSDVSRNVCARVGAECSQARNYGGAAYWFSRGNLVNKVQGVVEIAIADAEISGPGSESARLLSHVVSAATVAAASDVVKERIAFAQAYVQFQNEIAALLANNPSSNNMDDGSDKNEDDRFCAMQRAEQRALRLLCGGGLPKRFWPNIVYEICNVMDQGAVPKGQLATDTLYELLSALEAICSSSQYTDSLDSLSRRLERQDSKRGNSDDGAADRGKIDRNTDSVLQKMRGTLLGAITTSFASTVT